MTRCPFNHAKKVMYVESLNSLLNSMFLTRYFTTMFTKFRRRNLYWSRDQHTRVLGAAKPTHPHTLTNRHTHKHTLTHTHTETHAGVSTDEPSLSAALPSCHPSSEDSQEQGSITWRRPGAKSKCSPVPNSFFQMGTHVNTGRTSKLFTEGSGR